MNPLEDVAGLFVLVWLGLLGAAIARGPVQRCLNKRRTKQVIADLKQQQIDQRKRWEDDYKNSL